MPHVKPSPFQNRRKVLGEEHRSTQTDLPGYRGTPTPEEIAASKSLDAQGVPLAKDDNGFPLQLTSLPDVRQDDHFSCGAMVAAAVGGLYRVGPGWEDGKTSLDEEDKEAWKKALHTTEKDSTRPQAIIDYLRSLGLEVVARQGMSISDLAHCWIEGKPVICPVQEYGVPSKHASFLYGHYVAVIGVALGQVFVQDPSIDNALERPGGSIGEGHSDPDVLQTPGRSMIAFSTWDRVWHDEDADGNKYLRYGIIVGPGKVGQQSEKAYCHRGQNQARDHCQPRPRASSSKPPSAGPRVPAKGGPPGTETSGINHPAGAPAVLPSLRHGKPGKPGKKVKPSPFLPLWHKFLTKSGSLQGQPCSVHPGATATRSGCTPAEQGATPAEVPTASNRGEFAPSQEDVEKGQQLQAEHERTLGEHEEAVRGWNQLLQGPKLLPDKLEEGQRPDISKDLEGWRKWYDQHGAAGNANDALGDVYRNLRQTNEALDKGNALDAGYYAEWAGENLRRLVKLRPEAAAQAGPLLATLDKLAAVAKAHGNARHAHEQHQEDMAKAKAHHERMQDSEAYRDDFQQWQDVEVPEARKEFEESDELKEWRAAKADHDAWEEEHAAWEEAGGAAREKYDEAHPAWEERDAERQEQRTAINNLRAIYPADSAADEGKKAANLFATEKALNDLYLKQNTPEDREKYAEAVVDNLQAHFDSWEQAFGKDGILDDSLRQAGATDKDVTPYLRQGAKGKALLEKKGYAWQKLVDDSHLALDELDKHNAAEPEDPSEPDEPENGEPLTPKEYADSIDPNTGEHPTEEELAQHEEEYPAWKEEWDSYQEEKAAYQQWEADHEAWETRQTELEDAANDLDTEAGEAQSAFESVWDIKDTMDEKLNDLPDKLEKRLDKEDEADPEPEEPDKEDEPEEPDLGDEPEFEEPEPPDPRDYEPDEPEEPEEPEEEIYPDDTKALAPKSNKSGSLQGQPCAEHPGATAARSGCTPAEGHPAAVTNEAIGQSEFSPLVSRVASTPDAGFTYNVISQSQPTKGYALSLWPDRSFGKPAKELQFTDLVQYVVQNSDLLGQPGHYFGAWHNPDDGRVYLDVSLVTDNQDEAHAQALKHDQIAYFDIEKKQVVTVNKHATSGGAAHAGSESAASKAWPYSAAGLRHPGGVVRSVPPAHRQATYPGGTGTGQGAAGTGQKAFGGHSYGCLMANLPSELDQQIKDWVKENIPEEHLAEGGSVCDSTAHVTLRFGFSEDTKEQLAAIKELLNGHGPITLHLGNLDLFRGGEDGDVLHLKVDSPECVALNRALRDGFPGVTTHPHYHPHVTLAYLKPTFSASYTAMKPPFLNQRDVVIQKVEWSSASKKKTTIPLMQGRPLSSKKHFHSVIPKKPTLAVDFDGRIATLRPDLDLTKTVPREHTKEALELFQEWGIHVAIWTARNELGHVTEWMRQWELPFDSINSHPNEPTSSRKMDAGLYLDDKGEGDPNTPWCDLVPLVFERLINKGSKPAESYSNVRQRAEAALPEFQELLSSLGLPVVDSTGFESALENTGPFVLMGPVKEEERATDKVKNDYAGDWSQLMDMIRATVTADSMDELWGMVELLRNKATLARPVKDRFTAPCENGYRDLLANFLLPSGQTAEVQFHTRDSLRFREEDEGNYHSKGARGHGLVQWCAEKPCDFRKEELNIPRTKELDPQGGEQPTVSLEMLKRADFITLPSMVVGTSCGNCKHQVGGKCTFFDATKNIDLRGQPVTNRQCCAAWDSPGTLRVWQQKGLLGQVWKHKALSWLGSGTGGDLVAPPAFRGKQPKVKPRRPGGIGAFLTRYQKAMKVSPSLRFKYRDRSVVDEGFVKGVGALAGKPCAEHPGATAASSGCIPQGGQSAPRKPGQQRYNPPPRPQLPASMSERVSLAADKARKTIGTFEAGLKKVTDSVAGFARSSREWAKDKMEKMKQGIEKRYGKKGAKAILATGYLLGWVNWPITGIPIPSNVFHAVEVALAETVLQASRLVSRRKALHEEPEISSQEAEKVWQAFTAVFMRDFSEWLQSIMKEHPGEGA